MVIDRTTTICQSTEKSEGKSIENKQKNKQRPKMYETITWKQKINQG